MLREVELPFLTDKLKHDLQLLALDGMPNEVCGVIHPHGIIHQYQNTYHDPKLGFDMDVDVRNHTIVAVWHSHPGGHPEPSRNDIPVMEHLRDKGYPYPWIIITSKSVTAWTLNS